jgi:hypothetical protein
MHLISDKVAQKKVAGWFASNPQAVTEETKWIEKRLAIVYAGHTYLVQKEQIFQCTHCGHYDPKWDTTEVLRFFREVFGVEPTEIEIECSIPKGSLNES